MSNQRVLITGAAGAIGRCLRHGLRGTYALLRLSDIAPVDAPGDGEEVAPADLTKFDDVRHVMDGIDAVIHWGAIATEAGFDELLGPNFIGTYNIFEAARRQGANRVIFASSNHAIGFYPVGADIGINVAQRPDSFYGVGKAFGENLGVLYHEKWGVELASLRIGSFLDKPTARRHLSTWLSPGDMVRLARACIAAPDLGCTVLYGVSANTRNWWRNPEAQRIGYRPVDNAEDFAAEILATAPPEDPANPADRFMGGPIAAIDYEGN